MILITGARGFLGQHLVDALNKNHEYRICAFDTHDPISKLDSALVKADFIFHLAGVNRPKNTAEFNEVNFGLTDYIVQKLNQLNKQTSIAFASSTQAILANPYGSSKRKAEDALINYAQQTGSKIFLFRFTNIFGPGSKPNYNSAVATFCYNIAHGLEIRVDDTAKTLKLVFIDEAVRVLHSALKDECVRIDANYCNAGHEITLTLGDLVALIYGFAKHGNNAKAKQPVDEVFCAQLYTTYLSFSHDNGFA
jgi:UDP-2-acetamido-2,6-beta-L-arabino-hexul-4-ose reductase